MHRSGFQRHALDQGVPAAVSGEKNSASIAFEPVLLRLEDAAGSVDVPEKDADDVEGSSIGSAQEEELQREAPRPQRRLLDLRLNDSPKPTHLNIRTTFCDRNRSDMNRLPSRPFQRSVTDGYAAKEQRQTKENAPLHCPVTQALFV
uniref:Uncharacterized protein n=1 Tax=Knipowitschia caucasica TaxID=637954 RepID=A0AAV2KUJ8_KNICA